jgi:hypothetical protein
MSTLILAREKSEQTGHHIILLAMLDSRGTVMTFEVAGENPKGSRYTGRYHHTLEAAMNDFMKRLY